MKIWKNFRDKLLELCPSEVTLEDRAQWEVKKIVGSLNRGDETLSDRKIEQLTKLFDNVFCQCIIITLMGLNLVDFMLVVNV